MSIILQRKENCIFKQINLLLRFYTILSAIARSFFQLFLINPLDKNMIVAIMSIPFNIMIHTVVVYRYNVNWAQSTIRNIDQIRGCQFILFMQITTFSTSRHKPNLQVKAKKTICTTPKLLLFSIFLFGLDLFMFRAERNQLFPWNYQ